MATSSAIVFETDRLIVRTAAGDDVELFFKLWTNPQVMANVGFPSGLRVTRDDLRKKLHEQGDTEFERMLVVAFKTTGQALGECMMARPNQDGVASTDIKLLPEFWGNKYGVEVKQGLLRHLFTHTDCVAVEGGPNRRNIASIKMQEAVGGVRVSEGVYEFPADAPGETEDVPYYVYRVFREGWEKRRAGEA